ncbi:MAG TPA: HAD domain-containing protein [Thermoleophilaceae bacterium]|nr:HAD domain-containing protein [Thermoleophilaceae bacterium]
MAEHALARAGLVAASLPSRSELAKLPPAERRDLIRRAFDTPLRERPLRQLRRTIRQYGGCMRALSQRGRTVLELRAGLFGRDPASRRSIGRRIGASPRTVMRLERSSLRRLIEAGENGLCVGGSAATAFGGTGDGSDSSEGARPDRGGGSADDNRLSPAGDVLADAREGGPGIDLGDGEEGPAETMLFFVLALLVLLGPLAVVTIASRRRTTRDAALARAAGQRPLLFLDVDGVIVLDPLLAGIPHDRRRVWRVGFDYVPDRAGPLVRELATRFDIVWATGWEHRANADLLRPLGLREPLPVLTFGENARFGSSTWKTKPVKAYADNRPAAWLDDNFVASHKRWAARRPAPTLLVRVDSRVGLTADHVQRLIRWADSLAPAHVAEPVAKRRLLSG